MHDDEVERRDIEALLAARRELGADYERELVDSFAERVERSITERRAVADTVRRGADQHRGAGQIRQFVLGIGSLVAGIPITIVPTVAVDGGAGLWATAIGWIGIGAVNAAHAAALNGPVRRER